MSLICIDSSYFYECFLLVISVWRFDHRRFSRYSLSGRNYAKSINYKRHYYDPWLHLPISSLILSFSIQTSAIGNDIVTVISTRFGFDFSCPTYFETFQRFFEIFRRNENETSVQARDQREINCKNLTKSIPKISELSFFYSHISIYHRWPACQSVMEKQDWLFCIKLKIIEKLLLLRWKTGSINFHIEHTVCYV